MFLSSSFRPFPFLHRPPVDAPIVMVRRSLKGPQEKLPVDQYTMRNIAINGESLVQIKLGKKGVEERRSIISAEEAIAASKVPGKFLLLQSPFA